MNAYNSSSAPKFPPPDGGDQGASHLRKLEDPPAVEEQGLIVVVDDDEHEQQILSRWLAGRGYQVRCFGDAESMLAELPSMMPAAVCLDLHMPGMNGMDALRHIKANHSLLPVLVLTGDDEVSNAVTAMRLGAYDYLVKPIAKDRLLHQVHKALDHGRMGMRLAQLEREAEGGGYSGIVGDSKAIRGLFRELDRVSASTVTVLVNGESGCGKELVAESVHENSALKQGPFVALNCAAIPESLQESEMFGHEKGAFTGADKSKIGRFEEADGGTLFLDEVGELSLSLQAKLLRVLQERTFRRVGGRKDIQSNFRLVAATHRNLSAEVAAGNFREDLFYRLAVFEIEVPPLRDRKADIAPLTRWFLRGFAREEGVDPLHVPVETMQALEQYRWPGNVRELKNALQRVQVVAQDGVFRLQDLPPRILESLRGIDVAAELTAQATPTHPVVPPSQPIPQEPPASVANVSQVAPAVGEPVAPQSLAEMEHQAILQAIEDARGNMSEVARRLGIGRTTLYRKLKKFNIQA